MKPKVVNFQLYLDKFKDILSKGYLMAPRLKRSLGEESCQEKSKSQFIKSHWITLEWKNWVMSGWCITAPPVV